MYQDNKSTILLANNGRWSSSRRTKHIKSRYFYVVDKVNNGELTIKHRPTDQMWSDVLTKPKQGKGFRQDRAMLMNCPEDYDDEEERLRTDPKCLPRVEGPVDPALVRPMECQDQADPTLHHRSVLGVKHSRSSKQQVTWNTSLNRVDRTNQKARERHMELIVARILRDRERGALRGLE
jgi:hypothetical protein